MRIKHPDVISEDTSRDKFAGLNNTKTKTNLASSKSAFAISLLLTCQAADSFVSILTGAPK